MTEETKRCIKCGCIKPITQYYKRADGKTRGACIACEKIRTTEYRKKRNNHSIHNPKQVNTPCRHCAKLLTHKCDHQLLFLRRANQECQSFTPKNQ